MSFLTRDPGREPFLDARATKPGAFATITDLAETEQLANPASSEATLRIWCCGASRAALMRASEPPSSSAALAWQILPLPDSH